MSHIDEGELTAYADGAYAPDDPLAQRMAAHLAECANCRNRLAAASALSMRAGEVLAYAAPAHVDAPAFEQIRAAANTRRRNVFVPAAWAASILLALGLGWYAHTIMVPEQTNQIASAAERAASPAATAPVIPESAPVNAPPERVAAAEPRRNPAEIRSIAPQSAPAQTPATEVAVGALSTNAAAADLVQSAPPPAVETHLIAGLQVVATRINGDSLLVDQMLPDGTIVTLRSVQNVESRAFVAREQVAMSKVAAPQAEKSQRVAAAAPPPPPAAQAAVQAAAPARSSVVVVRGMRRIEITGALPLDSLKALAAKIQ